VTIQAPIEGGPTLSFPDGTDPSVIDAAVQAHVTAATAAAAPPPEQMQGIGRDVALPASNLVKGGVSLAGMPGDAYNAVANGSNGLANYLTGGFWPYQPTTNPWDSAHLLDTSKNLGITDRPDLTPQNTRERYTAAAADGVGSTLPLALASGGAGLLPALSALAQGIGAGTGGEFLSNMFPEHPDVARVLGGLFGAFTGGKVGSAATNAAVKGYNAVRGVETPLMEAYRTAGVDPVLAGDLTGSHTLRGVQAMGAKAPGGGRITDAAANAVDQFGNSVESTASNLGASRTLQEAGTALQNNARGWLQNFRDMGRVLWDRVNSQVPPDSPVSVHNYDAALEQVRRTIGDGAPNTADVLQPALTRRLFDALQLDASSNGSLSWQAVRGIRTRVGEMLANPQIIADTDTAELKRIYGALSQDIQTHLATVDTATGTTSASRAFNTANTFTRNGHAILDEGLGHVLQDGMTPEGAASYALAGGKRGGTFLNQLRTEIPGGVDELAAHTLRQAALSPPAFQNAANTRISPSRFQTEISRLSPEAHTALFGADPYVLRRIQAQRTVADSMKQTEQIANHSNTQTSHGMAAALGLGEAVPAGYIGYESGGVRGAIAGAATSIASPWVPGYLAGQATTRPLITSWLARPGARLPQSGPVATIGAGMNPGLLQRLLVP
jgi:hypothetical protein